MKKTFIIVLILALAMTLCAACGSNDQPAEKTDEQVIEELFMAKLEAMNEQSTDDKLLEYRVDSVNILSDEAKQEIIDSYDEYVDTDVLASVTYSIKPEKGEESVWAAGNGETGEDGWIINKVSCERLRDGKLNEYTATGW
ncbi:MAG: hypothetical protein IIU36_04825 [Firmicutes bacterium]|nr:hypothetical protein [Bacillota bacterium]